MDFNKYKNTMEYPILGNFTKYFGYAEGKCIYEGKSPPTPSTTPAAISATEKVIDQDAFRRARDSYQSRTNALESQFKEDLFEDLGITNNPKRDILYRIAYDRGHSNGYSEIYNEACDLVELIKEV